MSSNPRAWRGCDAEDPQKAQEEIESGRDRLQKSH